MMNNVVAACSSRKRKQTPERSDESPLYPPPGFPTANLSRLICHQGPPAVVTARNLDTDLRLSVGPHEPRTEERGGGGLELDLTLSGPLTSLTLSLNGNGLKEDNAPPSILNLHENLVDQFLKLNNEHVKRMLEEICQRENERVAIKLKEKDEKINQARTKIAKLEQMVKSLERTNHTLRVALEDVTWRLAALEEGGGNGVPARQAREDVAESSSVLGRP